MAMLKVNEISVHPFNLKVYGTPDAGLAESLREHGQWDRIVVDKNGQILAGARRWAAARKLGWTEIRGETKDVDGIEAEKYILLSNQYRGQKPEWMRLREADEWYRLRKEGEITPQELREAAEQKASGRAISGPDRIADLAAAAAGLGHSSYKMARHVRERSKALAEIKATARDGSISKKVAERLIKELQADRASLAKGELAISTAYYRARQRLDDAIERHGLSREEVAAKEAQARMQRAIQTLHAAQHQLEDLYARDDGRYLDGDFALILVNAIYSNLDLLARLADQGRMKLPTKAEATRKLDGRDISELIKH